MLGSLACRAPSSLSAPWALQVSWPCALCCGGTAEGSVTGVGASKQQHACCCHINRAKPDGEEDDLASFLEGQGKGGVGGPVDVPEAANDADLERLCGAKSGLCAVALLDASDEAFQSHLGTWKEAAGKWAKQPLHFLWVECSPPGQRPC